ncbi:MAG: ArsC/Spx/MgsR family protein [Chroococcales cyanobacterium]
MVQVIFYEKPGCINNGKQIALLRAAGHEVITYDLLKTPWTVDSLRPFFGDRPVAEWFNQTAPSIKSGEVVPEQLSPETALELMVNDPLLIRRPLIQVEDIYQSGFDATKINAWIGLATPTPFDDLETCPHT